MRKHFYNKKTIKIGDMRVDFYTLDVRNLGQAEGAHKVGASERTSQNPLKSLDFNGKRSDHGVHRLAEPQGKTSPLDSTGKPIS